VYLLYFLNPYSIRHPKEKISKSSIVPSKIIAPDHVEIKHELDVSPIRRDDDPYDSVVLLFPTDDAQSLTEMSEKELHAIKRVVLIDCTWG
jgi:DTW domain-containing protein YfiP